MFDAQSGLHIVGRLLGSRKITSGAAGGARGAPWMEYVRRRYVHPAPLPNSNPNSRVSRSPLLHPLAPGISSFLLYASARGGYFIKMSKSPRGDIKAPYNVDFHLFYARSRAQTTYYLATHQIEKRRCKVSSASRRRLGSIRKLPGNMYYGGVIQSR